jgi:hypothetical protein
MSLDIVEFETPRLLMLALAGRTRATILQC